MPMKTVHLSNVDLNWKNLPFPTEAHFLADNNRKDYNHKAHAGEVGSWQANVESSSAAAALLTCSQLALS